jgi:CRP-like cAMP-binding protein
MRTSNCQPGAERSSPDPASCLRLLFDDTPRVTERFTPIARAGEPFRYVFLLASGWACRERLLPDGRRVLLDLYVPGDIIGIDHLFSDVVQDNVVALTKLSYHSLDRDVLTRCSRDDSEVALLLLERATMLMRKHYQQIVCLARLPAIERAAVFLAHLCERLPPRSGSNGEMQIRVPLTQRDLADHLGLNIIHLNRTLRALRSAGIVQTQNGGLVVNDLALLRSMLKV